jgi:hypothetical protein
MIRRKAAANPNCPGEDRRHPRKQQSIEGNEMPDILVEARGDWLAGHEVEFLDAIHEALVTVLGYPVEDKLLRLITHAPSRFAIPHGTGDRFTRIEIVLFAGRTLDAKRAIYKAVVRALEPFGVPASDVKIVLVEIPTENVGFRGGVAACDVELGYEIGV